MKLNRILLFSLTALIACNHNPYKETNKVYAKQAKAFAKELAAQPPLVGGDTMIKPQYWVGTTNFNMRKPNFVIIHHTAQNSCEQTLKTFTLPRTQVSSHYVICKDGTVHQMLNDYLRAWHGGIARWGNNTDINSSSIGIEIDNNGFEKFTDAQINSLLELLGRLKKTHGVPAANFIGHEDIAPSRKVDPNVHFPWKLLADRGFGNWYNDTTGVQVPENFNNVQALRIIGYDVKDSSAAIGAFKRHFMMEDKSKTLNEADRKVLYQLMKKYM
jgi:N-acetylmuramoyl-L-alanine amidase